MIKQNVIPSAPDESLVDRLTAYSASFPRRTLIGIILTVALLAFEMFNFDTTRYALGNLLGGVNFLGLGWASILAVAFCAIDFAGLVRLFTPEKNGEEPREVWFLMGAWLLGATMNALMTWWAVSLTLLEHEFGNEVLSRGQLLQIVPVFVAVLVWLTRILFIGALTVTGEHLLEFGVQGERKSVSGRRPVTSGGRRQRPTRGNVIEPQPTLVSKSVVEVEEEAPAFLHERRQRAAHSRPGMRPVVEEPVVPASTKTTGEESPPAQSKKREDSRHGRPNGRVRQRPPIPGAASKKTLSARSRSRN